MPDTLFILSGRCHRGLLESSADCCQMLNERWHPYCEVMPSEPFAGVLLSRNNCLAGFLSANETQAAVTDDIVTDDSTLPQNFGPEPEQVARFIAHWAPSGGAERANFPSFAHNLCDVLAVPHPEPTLPDVSENAYVFERDVTFQNLDGSTSIGRIDLYKRSCFVLDAKQGSEQTEADDTLKLSAEPKKKTKRGTAIRGTKGWDDAMVKARGQAEQYARALPTDEGWPPFLIVVDVGHSIELFADFSRSGKTYLPFPDPGSFRIKLEQLADPEQREKLRTVWTDPLSLDPSRRSAPVLFEEALASWQTGWLDWRSRWRVRTPTRRESLSS